MVRVASTEGAPQNARASVQGALLPPLVENGRKMASKNDLQKKEKKGQGAARSITQMLPSGWKGLAMKGHGPCEHGCGTCKEATTLATF